MSEIARPVNGSYGVIQGTEITEEVLTRLVRDAEGGYPGASFRTRGRPPRANEPSRAVTVRLSDAELAAVMAHAEREKRTRSEAIRAAITEWSQFTG